MRSKIDIDPDDDASSHVPDSGHGDFCPGAGLKRKQRVVRRVETDNLRKWIANTHDQHIHSGRYIILYTTK